VHWHYGIAAEQLIDGSVCLADANFARWLLKSLLLMFLDLTTASSLQWFKFQSKNEE
jgi:hypothetical protein